MTDYDVVVIGAGNGGLTAAASLARKGARVLLLERHNIPGGSATSFCRGRFEFEVALHQLSGMGRPEQPGPLRMLLGSLGVLDDLEFLEMKELFNLVLPDGSKLALKPERAAVVEAFKERFPHEAAAVDRFFDLVYQYANEMVAAFVFRDPETSPDKYPVLFSHALKPAGEVLDEIFSDPVLKAAVSVYWGYLGLPPSRLSFAYLAMLYFTYIEFKPYHLKGGSQAMSSAIYNKFISEGGEAWFNCGAEKIIVEDGRVKGVTAADGRSVRADYVVSNASQVATYVGLIEPGLVPDQALYEMRGRSLSPSAFTLYIGFDAEPEALGFTESTNFLMFNTEVGDGIMARMRNLEMNDELLVMSCYNLVDPDVSPPGTSIAGVVTLKYGEPWLRLPPEEYYRTKFRLAEVMLNNVEKAFPGIKGHIEEIEPATPLTHMRYLGHPNGAIYGFEHYTKDAMFFQPGRYSPIKGLFFAGGWMGDAGFQPTLESGRNAARSIARALGL